VHIRDIVIFVLGYFLGSPCRCCI